MPGKKVPFRQLFINENVSERLTGVVIFFVKEGKTPIKKNSTFVLIISQAAIAQSVEHQLPKLRVASSNLVCRS
jgi:hypothetical protein